MNDLFSAADAAAAIRQTEADWRPEGWPENGIPPHPFANINRMMTDGELAELSTSIAGPSGLLEEIVMFEDKILEGRSRYLSCVKAGRFPANVDWRTHQDFVEFGGSKWDPNRGADPLLYVWNREIRRHTSTHDRALAAARFRRHIDQRGDQDKGAAKKPTEAELAQHYGVSERLLNSAAVLLAKAVPEVQDAVSKRRMSLTDAADVSRLAPEEQREIARAPDRKATKKAVKAAKANKAPPMPDLPSPIGRTDLAEFAETILIEAIRVASKHGGAGASMGADLVLNAAHEHGLLELTIIKPASAGKSSAKQPEPTYGFTRAMLLALGKLREPARPAGKTKAKDEPKLSAPPLGGELAQQVQGLKTGHRASFAVFAEEDGTYSNNIGIDFGVVGASEPFSGAFTTFEEAIGAAASRLRTKLNGIANANEGNYPAGVIASAKAGMVWIEKWAAGKGIALDLSVAREPVNSERAYADALAAGAAHKGKHTKATAEPILRAGVAANIRRQQMAEDMDAPIGSIKGWSGRLGLQESSRNPIKKRAA